MGLDAARTVIVNVVPVLQIEWVSPTEHWAAVQAWLSLNRRQISLVDCVSFVQIESGIFAIEHSALLGSCPHRV